MQRCKRDCQHRFTQRQFAGRQNDLTFGVCARPFTSIVLQLKAGFRAYRDDAVQKALTLGHSRQ
jgi:hypothetical protein